MDINGLGSSARLKKNSRGEGGVEFLSSGGGRGHQ